MSTHLKYSFNLLFLVIFILRIKTKFSNLTFFVIFILRARTELGSLTIFIILVFRIRIAIPACRIPANGLPVYLGRYDTHSALRGNELPYPVI